jgi:hypothetical protein
MKPTFYSETLSNHIKTFRYTHDLSVADLSNKMTLLLRAMELLPQNSSVSTQTIYNYEAPNSPLSLDYALALGAILELDFEDLIPREVYEILNS